MFFCCHLHAFFTGNCTRPLHYTFCGNFRGIPTQNWTKIRPKKSKKRVFFQAKNMTSKLREIFPIESHVPGFLRSHQNHVWRRFSTWSGLSDFFWDRGVPPLTFGRFLGLVKKPVLWDPTGQVDCWISRNFLITYRNHSGEVASRSRIDAIRSFTGHDLDHRSGDPSKSWPDSTWLRSTYVDCPGHEFDHGKLIKPSDLCLVL